VALLQLLVMEPHDDEQIVPSIAVSPDMEPKINKQKGSLTTFFAFAVIIVSIIAGFFAYQNQKLVKELRDKTSNTKTPESSPTPNSISTSDWKTYKNEKYGFEFKYPNTINEDLIKTKEGEDRLVISPVGEMRISSTSISICNSKLVANCKESNYNEVGSKNFSGHTFKIFDNLTTVGDPCDHNSTKPCSEQTKYNYIVRVWELKISTKAFLQFEAQDTYSPTNPTDTKGYMVNGEDIISQILSTIKFQSPSPSPTTKAQGCIEKTTCTGTAPCMTNPASTFCTCMGGISTIKTLEDGNQSGVCTIDGKAQDEWVYYRSFISDIKTIMPK
jgi:putative hemolysin